MFVGVGWGTFLTLGLAAFALAAIVDKDTATETFGKVTDAVGTAVGQVGKALGKGLSGITEGAVTAVQPLFSSIGGWLLAAAGAYVGYKFITSEKQESQSVTIKTEPRFGDEPVN